MLLYIYTSVIKYIIQETLSYIYDATRRQEKLPSSSCVCVCVCVVCILIILNTHKTRKRTWDGTLYTVYTQYTH
jgi:carbon starvation protein CstA